MTGNVFTGRERSGTTEATCDYCGLRGRKERVAGHDCPETCPNGHPECPAPDAVVPTSDLCAACATDRTPALVRDTLGSRFSGGESWTDRRLSECDECGFTAPDWAVRRHDHTACPNGDTACDGPGSLRTCPECRRR